MTTRASPAAGVDVRPGRFTFTVGWRAGRARSAFRDESSTVPFEQIGQSAVKRLWRQKREDKTLPIKISPVTTAIISDLHLGATTNRDVLRREAALSALIDALRDVDELVLLGDVIELRDSPVARVLAAARPVLAEIGRAMSARPITIVAGNH